MWRWIEETKEKRSILGRIPFPLIDYAAKSHNSPDIDEMWFARHRSRCHFYSSIHANFVCRFKNASHRNLLGNHNNIGTKCWPSNFQLSSSLLSRKMLTNLYSRSKRIGRRSDHKVTWNNILMKQHLHNSFKSVPNIRKDLEPDPRYIFSQQISSIIKIKDSLIESQWNELVRGTNRHAAGTNWMNADWRRPVDLSWPERNPLARSSAGTRRQLPGIHKQIC